MVPQTCNSSSNRRPGFTLVELVLIVLVLGIIAATAGPRVSRFRESAGIKAAATHLLSVEKAAQHFYAQNGRWPNDVPRATFPSDFAGYLSATAFTSPSPIGGDYDWNGEGRFGDVYAGVSIHFGSPAEFPAGKCVAIDTLLDDGNLNTGRVKSFNGQVLQLELVP